jgi:Kae1-associated kinase Bud32
MDVIGHGAEAKVFLSDSGVIKKRDAKRYRLAILDSSLRKGRTKREIKILKKLEALSFPAPRILDDSKSFEFRMTLIKGLKLKDVLDAANYKEFAKELAKKIIILHKHDIIHGDLTSSNLMYGTLDESTKQKEIFFIDFGLSFISKKVEDKAVDLHVLKQARDSYHHSFSNDCFKIIIDTYTSLGDSAVLERLTQVESRGKNK